MNRWRLLALVFVACLFASCQTADEMGTKSLGHLTQTPEEEAISFVLALGGKVGRDESLPGRPVVVVDMLASRVDITDSGIKKLAVLKDLRRLELGGSPITDAGLSDIKMFRNLDDLGLMMAHITDAGIIDLLKEVRGLRKLDLTQTRVTDACLKKIKEIKGLEELRLTDTVITDAGLGDIKELSALKLLALINTNITDAGLKELRELKNLKVLYLAETEITDDGLKELGQLASLKELGLRGTRITDAGLNDLKKAMPGTTIYYRKSRGHHPNR